MEKHVILQEKSYYYLLLIPQLPQNIIFYSSKTVKLSKKTEYLQGKAGKRYLLCILTSCNSAGKTIILRYINLSLQLTENV